MIIKLFKRLKCWLTDGHEWWIIDCNLVTNNENVKCDYKIECKKCGILIQNLP